MLLLLLPASAFAYDPGLQSVMPRGGQRGTELDLHLHGERLGDAQEILFYSPGITVTSLHPDKAGSDSDFTAHLVIAPDARIGEYALRLRTLSGISRVWTFWVGPYPIVQDADKSSNHDFTHAKRIELNVTVAGTVLTEAVNYYLVNAKKGQRLTVEVLGMRLGGEALFDPCVAIFDGKKKQIAFSDDTAFALADPVASIIVPADGPYYIVLRESTYGGSPDSHFLMHVGTFPRPTTTYPLGGPAGQPLDVTFLGDVRGPIAQTIPIPADATGNFDVIAEQDGLSAPTPNRIRLSSCVNILSNQANHSLAKAMVTSADPPLALNGVISQKGQADYFRIACHKNHPLNVRVIARALRSPIDSVLTIYDAKGQQLQQNDDTDNFPDSYLHFVPPGDGQYVVRINDQLWRGGADYTYRIEVTDDTPGLATGLFVPQNGGNATTFETIAVPQGSRCATIARIYRSADFNGPARLSAPDLPPGVKMVAQPVAAGQSQVAVMFSAAGDAPVAGKLCGLHIESTDPRTPASGDFRQNVVLTNLDNAAICSINLDRMAVAVTPPTPLSITVATPKVPLVQGGTMDLKIHVDRQAGAKGSLELRVLDSFPPGVEAPSNVTVSPGHDDVTLPLSAATNASVGTVMLCVVGENHVSSDFFPVQIVEPMLGIKLPQLTLRPGQTQTEECPLDQHEKFAGPAKLQLLGLPPGCTAADVQVTDADAQATFVIVTDATAKPLKLPSVFVGVTIQKNGEPIVFNIARGTMVRVVSPRGSHGSPSSPTASAASARKEAQ